jgi:hypothetical protein
LNKCSIAIIILQCIVAFFLENNEINVYLKLIILVILGLIPTIVENISKTKVKEAATIQEYIDRNLYNFKILNNTINRYTIDTIKDIIVSITGNESKYYKQQISTTGNNKKPGLMNWYSTDDKLDIKNAIYNCQIENTWWNKKLDKIYFNIRIIIYLFVIISLFFVFNDKFIEVCIICVSLISIIIKRISNYCLWKKTINVIEELQKNVIKKKLNNISKGDIENIQEKIYELRMTGYKTPNYIHKINSLKLHKQIKEVLNFRMERKNG